MFDKIQEISKQSKAERWPFPKTLDALKAAGVDYYDVDVATHQITYHADDKSFAEDPPEEFQNLQVAQRFDKQAVSDAISHHVKEKTSYHDFLISIAKAGGKFYRVDMSKRTVSYRGSLPEEEYVDQIPQI